MGRCPECKLSIISLMKLHCEAYDNLNFDIAREECFGEETDENKIETRKKYRESLMRICAYTDLALRCNNIFIQNEHNTKDE